MNSDPAEKYQVEADWVINLLCNYSCDYCFSSSNHEHELVGRLSPQQYLKFFNETGKSWLLHFTGGEPFLSPQFVELCQTLSTAHFIALNSNLSTDEVYHFADALDPERVEYIHCGVHFEQREQHEGMPKLLDKIQALLDKGFAVFASSVMTKEAFDKYERVREMFAAVGVPLIPKALRGDYQENHYPASYTPGERRKFRAFSQIAQEDAAHSRWNPLRNNPTINSLLDQNFLDGFPDFTGIDCAAGRDFVRIDPGGNIYRCGERSLIGSIFEGWLELYDSPRPCDDSYCPYFCFRHTGIETAQAQKFPKGSDVGALINRHTELVQLRGIKRVAGL